MALDQRKIDREWEEMFRHGPPSEWVFPVPEEGNPRVFREPVTGILYFDPDQPRDEQGRWTSGGGGAVSLETSDLSSDAQVCARAFPPENLSGPQAATYQQVADAVGSVHQPVAGETCPVEVATGNEAGLMSECGQGCQVMLDPETPGATYEPDDPTDIAVGADATPAEMLRAMGSALDYGPLDRLSDTRMESVGDTHSGFMADQGWTTVQPSASIYNSPEFQDLVAKAGGPEVVRSDISPIPATEPDTEQAVAQYAVDPNETFGRAYAQWVATRSGDEELLNSVMDRSTWTIDNLQWSPENFEPIGKQFDELFTRLGVMNEPVELAKPGVRDLKVWALAERPIRTPKAMRARRAIASGKLRPGPHRRGSKFLYDPDQARDERGRWTSGGVADITVSLEGSGTPDQPYKVGGNIELAADLLAQGRSVELAQPREVSTLLDEIQDRVQEAKEAGKDAPNYNLCNASVEGTNLFCGDNVGFARVEMPQLKGPAPEGSLAASLDIADVRGETDITPAFRDYLADKYDVVSDSENAAMLRASQTELNGAKVAGMTEFLDEGGRFDPQLMLVSRDNYIVDGHHRWAATIGNDAYDGDLIDNQIDVQRVDIDVGTLLEEARGFAARYGLPQVGVTGGTFKLSEPCGACGGSVGRATRLLRASSSPDGGAPLLDPRNRRRAGEAAFPAGDRPPPSSARSRDGAAPQSGDGPSATRAYMRCDNCGSTAVQPDLSDPHTARTVSRFAEPIDDCGCGSKTLWEEGDHPRDEKGRFTSGGGGETSPTVATDLVSPHDKMVFPVPYYRDPPEAKEIQNLAKNTADAIADVHQIPDDAKMLPIHTPGDIDAGGAEGTQTAGGVHLDGTEDVDPDRMELPLDAYEGEMIDTVPSVFAHEFGHYIDTGPLGDAYGQAFFTETDEEGNFKNPDAQELMDDLLATREVQTTIAIADGSLEYPDPERVEAAAEQAQYLSSPMETFARAYAQYIGQYDVTVADGLQIEGDLQGPFGQISQWSDESFEPIAHDFDNIFDTVGWKP